MNRILLGSLDSGAGKTSIALGLGQLQPESTGYLKPFGDHPLYRKKRLWDADGATLASVLDLGDDPTAISIGFDHSKIRYIYDDEGLILRLEQMAARMEDNKHTLVIEAGANFSAGASVQLDVLTLATRLSAPLYVVLSGESSRIADHAAFVARCLRGTEICFGGFIVNKVSDLEDFEITCRPALQATHLPVAGVIPYEKRLSALTLPAIANQLVARLVVGKLSAERPVESIFFGTMSAGAAQGAPDFQPRDKLVVTTADHSDLILASIEAGATGILLAGDPLPHASLLSMAEEKNVPILVTHHDLFALVASIQKLESKLTSGDPRIRLLRDLIQNHVTFLPPSPSAP